MAGETPANPATLVTARVSASRRLLSDSTFVGLGLVAFLSAFVLQYGLYHRLLSDRLRTGDIEHVRPAIMRWMKVAIVSQLLVLGACVLYLAALSSRHGHSALWIAPAVGAAFGTALPLQFVVMAILRSVRGGQ
jgi:hypothetical protein